MMNLCEWAVFHQKHEIFEACAEYFEANRVEIQEDTRLSMRLLFYGCRKLLAKMEEEDITEALFSELSSYLSRIVSSYWNDYLIWPFLNVVLFVWCLCTFSGGGVRLGP
jgi:hypothetical protein